VDDIMSAVMDSVSYGLVPDIQALVVALIILSVLSFGAVSLVELFLRFSGLLSRSGKSLDEDREDRKDDI
jgi:hypothetical protein